MIKKIIKKIREYFLNEYEDEYLEQAAVKHLVPLNSGRLKDNLETDILIKYNTPYIKQVRITTPEVLHFHLKTIRTIFKTWEQDINDTSIKDSSSSYFISGYAYYSDNCEKPSCVLVESNGRN